MKELKASQLGFNPHYSEDAPSIEEVGNLDGDAIIEFGAPWCPHCQAARRPIKEALIGHTESHPGLRHIKVYDGKGKKLGRAYRVKLWPTLIMLHDGKELARAERPLHRDEIALLLNAVGDKKTSIE